jgi:hypothetical protein
MLKVKPDRCHAARSSPQQLGRVTLHLGLDFLEGLKDGVGHRLE